MLPPFLCDSKLIMSKDCGTVDQTKQDILKNLARFKRRERDIFTILRTIYHRKDSDN